MNCKYSSIVPICWPCEEYLGFLTYYDMQWFVVQNSLHIHRVQATIGSCCCAYINNKHWPVKFVMHIEITNGLCILVYYFVAYHVCSCSVTSHDRTYHRDCNLPTWRFSNSCGIVLPDYCDTIMIARQTFLFCFIQSRSLRFTRLSRELIEDSNWRAFSLGTPTDARRIKCIFMNNSFSLIARQTFLLASQVTT